MEISGNGLVNSAQEPIKEKRLTEDHLERMKVTNEELQEKYDNETRRLESEEDLANKQSMTSDLNTGKSLDITG